MTRKSIITLSRYVKRICGTLGMTALVVDYKWTGIAILVVGAIADQTLFELQKGKKIPVDDPAEKYEQSN